MQIENSIVFFGKTKRPLGGVTIKNRILLSFLQKKYKTVHLTSNILNIPFLLFFNIINRFIIISISSKSLLRIIKLLYKINKDNLKNIIVFIPGGIFDSLNLTNFYISLNSLKALIVEKKSMLISLQDQGFSNVVLIPNFRSQSDYVKPSRLKIKAEALKFVFISRIEPMKGPDIALETFKLINNYSIDFFGPIKKTYKKEFLRDVNSVPNASYLGELNSNDTSMYELLRNYDVLIFPTKYKSEGIPGIIIEAKMAGLIIVTSRFDGVESLVSDNLDGFIIKNNSTNELLKILKTLKNKDLKSIKTESYKSSKQYDIQNFSIIISSLIEEKKEPGKWI